MNTKRSDSEMGQVVGIGIDLCDPHFFRHHTPITHPGFYALAFTQREQEFLQEANVPCVAQAFAACFAIKEATVKALSTAGHRVAVPQVETDLARGIVRIVSRRGETVLDLGTNDLRLVATHGLWAQNNTRVAVAQVVAVRCPAPGRMN